MAVQTTQFGPNPGRRGIAASALVGGRFGKWGGTTDLEISYAGAGETAHGIVGGTFASGDPATMFCGSNEGVLEVNGLGTAIARGDFLKPSASGIGIKATSGEIATAIAKEASSASGDVIEVEIITPTVVTAVADSTSQPYLLPLEGFRVHDALATSLPTTAANDDLGLIPGTFGTDAVVLRSVDFGGTTTTAYGRIRFALPPEYVAGESVVLRVNAGMVTTVSDTTATIDAVVYSSDDATADICATAAQSINSLTAANKDFTITATNLAAGDLLDIRLAFAGNDSGDAGVMIGQINSAHLLITINS